MLAYRRPIASPPIKLRSTAARRVCIVTYPNRNLFQTTPLANLVSGYSHSRDILAAVKTLYSFFHVYTKKKLSRTAIKAIAKPPRRAITQACYSNCAQSSEPFSSFIQVYEYST